MPGGLHAIASRGPKARCAISWLRRNVPRLVRPLGTVRKIGVPEAAIRCQALGLPLCQPVMRHWSCDQPGGHRRRPGLGQGKPRAPRGATLRHCPRCHALSRSSRSSGRTPRSNTGGSAAGSDQGPHRRRQVPGHPREAADADPAASHAGSTVRYQTARARLMARSRTCAITVRGPGGFRAARGLRRPGRHLPGRRLIDADGS